MNKIQCEECICVPICRMKNYRHLLSECKFISELLYDSDFHLYESDRKINFNRNIQLIELALQPVQWQTIYDKSRGRTVIVPSSFPERGLFPYLYNLTIPTKDPAERYKTLGEWIREYRELVKNVKNKIWETIL